MRPTVPESTNGLVLLHKEPGVTSFQALYPIKRRYGNAVGHTGTLDRFAEGLLVVLVGKFTKFNPLFTAFDKVYEADFTFGVETDTLDPEGQVIFEGGEPQASLVELAPRWVGPQQQVPPEYSAIHVQGRRASERIRDGETVALEARPITVHSLEILAWRSPVLTVRIHCSKGTYVRSIARDWGRASGFGAHVTRLKRTQVGPFALPGEPWVFQDSRTALTTLRIPSLVLSPGVVDAVRHGRDPLEFVPSLGSVEGNRAGLEDPEGALVAVVERQERWKYLFVDQGTAP